MTATQAPTPGVVSDEVIRGLLERVRRHAERDPALGVVQARVFAEAVCERHLGAHGRVPGTAALDWMIDELTRRRAVLRFILTHLRSIQSYGNLGAHVGEGEAPLLPGDISPCLMAVERVAEWCLRTETSEQRFLSRYGRLPIAAVVVIFTFIAIVAWKRAAWFGSSDVALSRSVPSQFGGARPAIAVAAPGRATENEHSLGDEEANAERDGDDAIGRRILACFHWTATFVGFRVGRTYEKDGFVAVDGKIQFDGLKFKDYTMKFTTLKRAVKGRREFKIVVGRDTAMRRPSDGCRFRSWTEE